jgi:hypothetical protein
LAKNRYGWNKRIKEIARKMKQEEKIKRRQGKSPEKAEEPAAEENDVESGPSAGMENG